MRAACAIRRRFDASKPGASAFPSMIMRPTGDLRNECPYTHSECDPTTVPAGRDGYARTVPSWMRCNNPYVRVCDGWRELVKTGGGTGLFNLQSPPATRRWQLGEWREAALPAACVSETLTAKDGGILRRCRYVYRCGDLLRPVPAKRVTPSGGSASNKKHLAMRWGQTHVSRRTGTCCQRTLRTARADLAPVMP
jgi:hypothetical protein